MDEYNDILYFHFQLLQDKHEYNIVVKHQDMLVESRNKQNECFFNRRNYLKYLHE